MDNEVRFERFLCPGKRLKSFSKLILSSKIIQIILTYAKFRFVHPSSYKPIGILSIEFWHDCFGWLDICSGRKNYTQAEIHLKIMWLWQKWQIQYVFATRHDKQLQTMNQKIQQFHGKLKPLDFFISADNCLQGRYYAKKSAKKCKETGIKTKFIHRVSNHICCASCICCLFSIVSAKYIYAEDKFVSYPVISTTAFMHCSFL